ncbi:Rpn family recombination-promoting nuclease/putative transposase [Leadbetterella sp. DM7]|uniref:Rpn family recombination-promoting nuclease/putative transposase n=1 Tax=Leadbetterella sp. DM7 TaxID=3235085 RepID=UPI00349EF8FE
MPRNITDIHDKFIKQILSRKELAAAFLQQYLPEELVSILDFETLKQRDTSYITGSLKTSYSDGYVLYDLSWFFEKISPCIFCRIY